MGHWLSSLSLINYEERGFQQSGAWNSIPFWEADFFSYRSRGPAPGLTTSITCCVTAAISYPQTSASLSLKAEVDEVFTSPPACLSSPPSLHQRPFLSLSLEVWNSHLDLILWAHPHQISICYILTLLSFLHFLLSLFLCPTEYGSLALHTSFSHLSNAYSSFRKLNSTHPNPLELCPPLHILTVLRADSPVFSETCAFLCSSSHHTVLSLSVS